MAEWGWSRQRVISPRLAAEAAVSGAILARRFQLLVGQAPAAYLTEWRAALAGGVAAARPRGWHATMRGVAAGLLLLAVIVAALGPALTVIPINALRLVVGGLLLVFGLGWLRKAILRACGFKDLHDEDAIYQRQREAAEHAE